MEENENNTLNNGGEEVKKDLTPPEGEPVSSVEAPVSASLEKEATIEQDGGASNQSEQVSKIDVSSKREAAVESSTFKEKFNKNKKRNIAIIAAIAVVVIALIIVGLIVAGETKAKQEYNNYINKLHETVEDIREGAVKAESLGTTVHDIWHSAIWKDDEKWDADIEPYHSDDFNEALSNFFYSTEGIKQVAEVEAYKGIVEDDMKELASPPKGCEQAYAAVSNVFDDYEKFCELATDPSGNLSSYTSQFNTYDSELAGSLRSVDSKIPELKN